VFGISCLTARQSTAPRWFDLIVVPLVGVDGKVAAWAWAVVSTIEHWLSDARGGNGGASPGGFSFDCQRAATVFATPGTCAWILGDRIRS